MNMNTMQRSGKVGRPKDPVGTPAVGRIARLQIGQSHGFIRVRNREVFFHRADLAVQARQEDVEIIARLGAAADGQRREDRDAEQNPRRAAQYFSPVRTTNSVPRTPRIAAGVLTFIASGVCLAILPETTERVPRLSELSNAP